MADLAGLAIRLMRDLAKNIRELYPTKTEDAEALEWAANTIELRYRFLHLTDSDRRFLRSLRIKAEDACPSR